MVWRCDLNRGLRKIFILIWDMSKIKTEPYIQSVAECQLCGNNLQQRRNNLILYSNPVKHAW